MPRLISLSQERFARFYHNPDLLPSAKYANSLKRQMRSEHREAVVRVMTVLLKYRDIMTGRIGIERNGFFWNIPADKIAEMCQISLHRTYRVFASLKAAGILKTQRQAAVVSVDGESIYREVPSIKTIPRRVLDALGLTTQLDKERARIWKRIQQREAPRPSTVYGQQTRMQLFLDKALANSKRPSDRARATVSEHYSRIWELHLDWAPPQLLKATAERLSRK